MKTKLFLTFAVFMAVMFAASSAFAAATQLTVSDASASPSGTATVTITANSGDLAGAAFTVTFDSAVFSITEGDITSEFFETFATMGLDPSSVDVDGTIYTKGLVANPPADSGTVLIAAANAAEKGTAGTEAVLFSLNFKVAADAADGDYTIGITPTTLNNESAGYDAAGEEIDLLVGVDGDTFPVRLSAAEAADNVTAGKVTLTSIIDGDATGDTNVNVDDIIAVINHIFDPTMTLSESGQAAADMDDNGSINVDDIIAIINKIFNPTGR